MQPFSMFSLKMSLKSSMFVFALRINSYLNLYNINIRRETALTGPQVRSRLKPPPAAVPKRNSTVSNVSRFMH